MQNQGDHPAQVTADQVARRSYGKLVAFLAARTGDVAGAEDALSDAFAAALRDWPVDGCPANPEAWLLTVARRKVIDATRRESRWAGIAIELEHAARPGPALEPEIPDQRLALMFACAHPAIDQAIRAPLVLQVVLGLNAKVIGSAFLISPSAMGKRLVRAKEKIRLARIPLTLPAPEELPARLDTILDTIYAAFAEGWHDPSATDPVRRDLSEEALFLAQLINQLLPDQPEAMGLRALLLHAEARRGARRSPTGDYVALSEQDQSLWDLGMIAQAERLLRQASAHRTPGRFQLEAAIQSAHVYRCRTGERNWADLVRLHDLLLTLTASPVVAINRAVAVAELDGPELGLAAMPQAEIDPRLAEYQPYWAARAELLQRAGQLESARDAYERAIGLAQDPAVRRYLQQRRA